MIVVFIESATGDKDPLGERFSATVQSLWVPFIEDVVRCSSKGQAIIIINLISVDSISRDDLDMHSEELKF